MVMNKKIACFAFFLMASLSFGQNYEVLVVEEGTSLAGLVPLASQAEVDAGAVSNKLVSPLTLENFGKWDNYLISSAPVLLGNLDANGNSITNLNLIESGAFTLLSNPFPVNSSFVSIFGADPVWVDSEGGSHDIINPDDVGTWSAYAATQTVDMATFDINNAGDIEANSVTAHTSAGMVIKNLGGSTVATFGAGAGTGVTIVGGLNVAGVIIGNGSGITNLTQSTTDDFGVVRLATQEEVNDATNSTSAVTPATLGAYSKTAWVTTWTQTLTDGQVTLNDSNYAGYGKIILAGNWTNVISSHADTNISQQIALDIYGADTNSITQAGFTLTQGQDITTWTNPYMRVSGWALRNSVYLGKVAGE